MITRLPDWRMNLDSLVYSRLHCPFAWGSNDCALFAADALKAITGFDISVGLREHRTALQATRTLRRHGGLRSIFTASLGDPIDAPDALQGDMLLIDLQGRDAMAVCISESEAVAPGPIGLVVGPTRSAQCAWRVG